MSRQEDFQEQSEKYANECGGTTQEKCAIMADYVEGAKYGYQYAIDKACEWLQENLYVLRTFKDPRVNKYEIFIRMLRGAMEE